MLSGVTKIFFHGCHIRDELKLCLKKKFLKKIGGNVFIIIFASFFVKFGVPVWIYICKDASLPMLIADQELSVQIQSRSWALLLALKSRVY